MKEPALTPDPATKPFCAIERPKTEPSAASGSYSTILKSTSIIGGSKAAEYGIGMLRTKAVALILGPSGVGMVGLFTSAISLVGVLAGLGIGSAGVRQIAKAHGAGDKVEVARSARVLRRLCWGTGILGWLISVAFCTVLSEWAFDDTQYSWLIAILGCSLLFTAISGGQKAIIQGTRRIGDLARISIISTSLGGLSSVAIYLIWGDSGIVPALILVSLISLGTTSWFARRIGLPSDVDITWRETIREGRSLTTLGVSMMWSALLAGIADITIRGAVLREFGFEGSGAYQASWALSGVFAGFIISAMGTDFYPRLSALSDKHEELNRIVNEQIEIGILLALPGLLATLFFSPIVILLLYSKEFAPANDLLPWFVLGIFCRVVSWPLGYTILAKGASRWFFLTQSHYYALQLLLTYLLIGPLKLEGVGIAFFITVIPASALNLFVTWRLTGFSWSNKVKQMLVAGSLTIFVAFATRDIVGTNWAGIIGIIVILIVSVINMRGIANRLGRDHRVTKKIKQLPFGQYVLPSEFCAVETESKDSSSDEPN